MLNDMVTSSNSTAQNTGVQLTFSQEDFHASHLAQPASEKERMITATSGRKCLESFEKFSRPTLWARMLVASLIGTGDWYSTKCKLTWRMRASKCKRFYFQLVPSTLRIEETEFGLLHTPTAKGNQLSPSMATRYLGSWGIPTPTASCKDIDTMERTMLSGQKKRQMKMDGAPYQTQTSGMLNPTWIEWLMGYPIGWTELSPSETLSSRKSRSKSSKQSKV